ncbi:MULTISPECIES: YitT family protein [unclassified Streptomyces]|uniref:membrane protein YczE n=1 Tax=unclassified Streptomyces TaxID=2593676 RepID=UPI00224D3929|nr:hypothetical protein [Streptomyces sp. NBC_01551]MCX4524624.1 hypothetical protein [Streptomyces sp. NBC_01551]
MSTTPPPPPRRLTRRLSQLYVGLALYGASSAFLVRAGLGLDPWDVFHQGLAERLGWSIGTVSVTVGALVLLLWVPLRQRPGLGTVSNVFAVGLSMDATLAVLPDVHGIAAQVALLTAGIVLNGVATGLYISAAFGPGPRDGLMTGLHRRTGRSVRLVRTGIELTVLAAGFLLGGTAGFGTLAYALAIGPLSQIFLKAFALPEPPPARAEAGAAPPADAGAATPADAGAATPADASAAVPADSVPVAAGGNPGAQR